MVFEKAWRFLKASRQTKLGEFHPDFPSSYGPVTMRRFHPTQEWGDNWLKTIDAGYATHNDFDPDEFQPYEKLIQEGIKPQIPTQSSEQWESDAMINREGGVDTDVKPFDIHEGKKGNWFYPVGEMGDKQKELSHFLTTEEGRRQIGVRIPIEQLRGQFRNKGYMNEPAEAFVEQHIPAQYLTQLPPDYTGEGQATWGARGE
jgi:hypothetical protein